MEDIADRTPMAILAKKTAQRLRESRRLWKIANKDKVLEQKRRYRMKHRSRLAALRRDRYANNPAWRAERLAYNNAHESVRRREEWRVLRADLLAHFGGACTCCGEADERFLTLEHKATADPYRKLSPIGEYRRLSRLGWPDHLCTLFCMNCNWGARKTGVCPHQEAANLPRQDGIHGRKD